MEKNYYKKFTHDEKAKAIDYLLWVNSIAKENKYHLVYDLKKGYFVEYSHSNPEGWGNQSVRVSKRNYKLTSKKHFKKIISDNDRLEHWENLINGFKKMDSELLKFILEKKVPLEEFIIQALKEI